MRASRKVSRWTRTWGLTLVSIGIFHFFPVQAQQETLTDKTGRGDDSQDHNPKHHHYKLEVIPSLGGLLTNFYHPENNIAVLNRQGAASGGSADTLLPERFPNYPWGDVGTTTHAYVWENGSLTDLGALDNTVSSFSAWISSNGIIAGASEKAEFDPLVPGIVDPSVPDFPETTAVVWHKGSITDIGFLPGGGYESRAVSVNNRGEVVGSATNLIPDANSFAVDSVFLLSNGYKYQSRAFIWDLRDGMRDLGTLGTGLDAAAYAINEQGQVIGYSYKDTTTPGGCTTLELTHAVLDMGAFIWDKQHGIRDVGNFGGTCTFASDLNNHGQVVGSSNVSGDLYQRPFLWEKGVLRDLGGSLGGNGATATRINEKGEVVGSANLAGEQTFHATLWRGVGQMTELGSVDNDPCAFGWAINDKTQVVGISSPACGHFDISRAFLWEDGSLVDLNTLIPPNSPLYLDYAYTINNRGEIAGNGLDAAGISHAFVLIPCDEDHRGDENKRGDQGCNYETVDAETADQVRPAHSIESPALWSAQPSRRNHVIGLGTLRAPTAYGGAGESASATTKIEPAPTNLTSVGREAGGRGDLVRLNWTNHSTDADSIHIEACSGSTCTNFSEIAKIAANATTYTQGLHLLFLDLTFRYRVRAHSPGGYSGYSNISTMILP